MNVDNFIVRPQCQLVERYADAGAWAHMTTEAVSELLGGVAGLPSTLTDEDQDAKQFDLLILRLQLTLLRGEPGFETLKSQVIGIAELLEEKVAIPMVAAQLPLRWSYSNGAKNSLGQLNPFLPDRNPLEPHRRCPRQIIYAGQRAKLPLRTYLDHGDVQNGARAEAAGW